MALTVNYIRVEQHGDTVLGECTQIGYVPKTGSASGTVVQENAVVAQVPVERGGDAVLGSTHRGEVQALIRS